MLETVASQTWPTVDMHVGHACSVTVENGGTATLGLIYVASGLGTGLGPLLMRRWLGDSLKRLMVGISIGFFLTGTGILALGLVNTLPAFLVATFIRTFGTGTIWVFSAVLLQILVPDRVKGRVFGFEYAALTLTESISVLAAGYIRMVADQGFQYIWMARRNSVPSLDDLLADHPE